MGDTAPQKLYFLMYTGEKGWDFWRTPVISDKLTEGDGKNTEGVFELLGSSCFLKKMASMQGKNKFWERNQEFVEVIDARVTQLVLIIKGSIKMLGSSSVGAALKREGTPAMCRLILLILE